MPGIAAMKRSYGLRETFSVSSLTRHMDRHHVGFVLRTNVRWTKSRSMRIIAVLCSLAVALVTAVHMCGPSGAARIIASQVAVSAASDDTAPASDRLVVEQCHVCTAIAASLSEGSDPEHGQVPLAHITRLISAQLKTTGPPPKL